MGKTQGKQVAIVLLKILLNVLIIVIAVLAGFVSAMFDMAKRA